MKLPSFQKIELALLRFLDSAIVLGLCCAVVIWFNVSHVFQAYQALEGSRFFLMWIPLLAIDVAVILFHLKGQPTGSAFLAFAIFLLNSYGFWPAGVGIGYETTDAQWAQILFGELLSFIFAGGIYAFGGAFVEQLLKTENLVQADVDNHISKVETEKTDLENASTLLEAELAGVRLALENRNQEVETLKAKVEAKTKEVDITSNNCRRLTRAASTPRVSGSRVSMYHACGEFVTWRKEKSKSTNHHRPAECPGCGNKL